MQFGGTIFEARLGRVELQTSISQSLKTIPLKDLHKEALLERASSWLSQLGLSA